MIKYEGLRPPEIDVPVIDLESVEGTMVDLYNDHTLTSVSLMDDVLLFSFRSVIKTESSAVTFKEVRDLRVVQPEGWVVDEADQIDHLLVRSDGHGSVIASKQRTCWGG